MGIHYRVVHPPKGAMEVFYAKIAPIVTGVGASVVIVGALFKIMHWPGASAMLIVGLSAEAALFLLFAFAPVEHAPDWTLIYPELADDPHGHTPVKKAAPAKESNNLVAKLDNMLDNSKLDQDVFNRLADGIKNLSASAGKMSDLSDAAASSNDFAKNVKVASASIVEMNKSFSTTAEAMNSMASASTGAKEYHTQVQVITKSLGALNAVYEMELQDANNHLKAMNKFYGNLSSAMEAMSEASRDTQQFKVELSKLTSNLTNLNNVYGSMLSAMKGN
jgi:gliding motility-associated protein GldL